MQDFKEEFYKRVYQHVIDTISFIERSPKDSHTQVLTKQLLRSITSVIANLVEAKSASSKKDYINFYTYSLKSANESKLQFCITRDTKNEFNSEAKRLLLETIEISNILAKSIITMKNNPEKKKQFYSFEI